MKTSTQYSYVGSEDGSLCAVAAYLEGVADATAALSNPNLAAVADPQAGHTLRAAPRYMTLPFENSVPVPPRRLTLPYPLPDPEVCEAYFNTGIEPTFDGDERPSGVRLRAAALAPEWYELAGVG